MIRLFALAALFFATAAAAAAPIEGQWTNPKHSVTVRIAPCHGGALCGRVTGASAKAKADTLAGSGHRLIGTELMRDFRADGSGGWSGTLLIPDIGKEAEASIRMVSANAIEVRGCGLGGLVCKNQTWSRVATRKGRRR